MTTVFLSLGSNLENKHSNLSKAINEIDKKIGHVSERSGIYETESWGFESENDFLNCVIKVNTDLEPTQLIKQCLEIEKNMGRERKENGNYESRIIDIDILFYDNWIVSEDKLQIPHPHLHKRRFILEPLNEIAPDLIHPLLEKPISILLFDCTDSGIVRLLDE